MKRQISDLPRCALSKVASRFLIGRNAPSFKEGIRPFQTWQYPLLEGGDALPNKQMERYLKIRRVGGGQPLLFSHSSLCR